MPDGSLDILVKTTADNVGTQQAAEGIADVTKQVEKQTISHQDLRAVMRGLSREFPELAHVAHLALNPITLSVAAIAGSFALWTKRVEELNTILGSLELPDLSKMDPGHINAVAKALGDYNVALAELREKSNDASDASSRRLALLDQEFESQKKVLDQMHALVQARAALAGKKVPGEEEDYEATKQRIELAQEQAKVDEKMSLGVDLMMGAEAKRREATQIKVASAADDKKTSADYAEAAKKAEEEITARKKRIGELIEYQAGEASWAASMRVKARQIYTGMSVEEMIQMERGGLAAPQAAVQAAQAWEMRQPARDDLRARRDELLKQAAADRSKGETLFYEELPVEEEMMTRRRATAGRIGDLSAATSAYKAATEAKKRSDDIASEVANTFEAGKRASDAAYQALRQARAEYAALEARIAQLEGAVKNQRR